MLSTGRGGSVFFSLPRSRLCLVWVRISCCQLLTSQSSVDSWHTLAKCYGFGGPLLPTEPFAPDFGWSMSRATISATLKHIWTDKMAILWRNWGKFGCRRWKRGLPEGLQWGDKSGDREGIIGMDGKGDFYVRRGSVSTTAAQPRNLRWREKGLPLYANGFKLPGGFPRPP